MYEIKCSTYNVTIYRPDALPDGNGGSQGKSHVKRYIPENYSDNSTFRPNEKEHPRDVAEERISGDLPLQLNEEECLQDENEENRLDNLSFRPTEEKRPRDVENEGVANSWSL